MTTKHPEAFFSYTRVDDEFFGGTITSLRKLLEIGVQVVTGDRSFHIFQDIDGIELGQKWQGEIDRVISEVKFLIPILTPSFLRSDACRDELGKFMKKERELGRDDLILPVYYVTTPSLEKPDLVRDDPLALEISRRQRYDWRSQADLPITDPQVRLEVKKLAEKISRAIERTELRRERKLDIDQLREKKFEEASERIFHDQIKNKIEPKLVLCVDDRPSNNVFERKALESYGVRFVLALSTEEALFEIEKLYNVSKLYFHAIISDMGRPQDLRAGYTFLKWLRSRGNPTPFFIYAGSRSPKHITEALERGAQGATNHPGELIEMVLTFFKAASK